MASEGVTNLFHIWRAPSVTVNLNVYELLESIGKYIQCTLAKTGDKADGTLLSYMRCTATWST